MSRAATARLKVNPIVGTPPVLEWIAPGDLQVDPSYQRSLGAESSLTLIRRIASYWDWGLCQPLSVARRADGSRWVVDGQHRWGAARMRGDIAHLPCVVTTYATRAEEAAAFVALNKERRALGAVDVFRAQLAAGDEQAMIIDRLIRDAGLSIAPHSNHIAWRPGMLFCVPGVMSAYRRYGRIPTSAALVALSEAFEGKVLRYAGQILRGLFVFYAAKGRFDDFDPDLFITRLGQNSQEQWMRRAAEYVAGEGGTQIAALTAVFTQAYCLAKGDE